MAIPYDGFLRGVPSDADSDDGRLYDPTAADAGGEITSTVTAATETYADGVLVETFTGAVTAATETAAAGTLVETFSGTVAASTETYAAGTLVESFTGTIAAGTETYAASSVEVAGETTSTVTAVTETSAEAVAEVINPEERVPTWAGGGGPAARRRKYPEYQIAAHADPQRPFATRLEPVPYDEPEAWTPETDTEEDETMVMLLAVFG